MGNKVNDKEKEKNEVNVEVGKEERKSGVKNKR
jgi:hypothetical protein